MKIPERMQAFVLASFPYPREQLIAATGGMIAAALIMRFLPWAFWLLLILAVLNIWVVARLPRAPDYIDQEDKKED